MPSTAMVSACMSTLRSRLPALSKMRDIKSAAGFGAATSFAAPAMRTFSTPTALACGRNEVLSQGSSVQQKPAKIRRNPAPKGIQESQYPRLGRSTRNLRASRLQTLWMVQVPFFLLTVMVASGTQLSCEGGGQGGSSAEQKQYWIYSITSRPTSLPICWGSVD